MVAITLSPSCRISFWQVFSKRSTIFCLMSTSETGDKKNMRSPKKNPERLVGGLVSTLKLEKYLSTSKMVSYSSSPIFRGWMFKKICGVSPASIPGNAPMEAPKLGRPTELIAATKLWLQQSLLLENMWFLRRIPHQKPLVIHQLVVEPTPLKNNISQNWESFSQFSGWK